MHFLAAAVAVVICIAIRKMLLYIRATLLTTICDCLHTKEKPNILRHFSPLRVQPTRVTKISSTNTTMYYIYLAHKIPRKVLVLKNKKYSYGHGCNEKLLLEKSIFV